MSDPGHGERKLVWAAPRDESGLPETAVGLFQALASAACEANKCTQVLPGGAEGLSLGVRQQETKVTPWRDELGEKSVKRRAVTSLSTIRPVILRPAQFRMLSVTLHIELNCANLSSR